MPLLYLFPLVSLIAFVVCVVLTIICYKDKKKGFLFLFIFILSTNVVFSLIEIVVIYYFKGLGDLVVKDNIGIYLMLLFMNLLTFFIKEFIILRGIKKAEPNYERITTKLNLVDPINLIMVIVTVLLFK